MFLLIGLLFLIDPRANTPLLFPLLFGSSPHCIFNLFKSMIAGLISTSVSLPINGLCLLSMPFFSKRPQRTSKMSSQLQFELYSVLKPADRFHQNQSSQLRKVAILTCTSERCKLGVGAFPLQQQSLQSISGCSLFSINQLHRSSYVLHDQGMAREVFWPLSDATSSALQQFSSVGHSPVKVSEVNNSPISVTCITGFILKVWRSCSVCCLLISLPTIQQLSTRIFLCQCCNVRACGS